MRPKVRYETIDVARGLAIILVVWGHYYTHDMPSAYGYINKIIYMFHIPLFMFVSGFLAVATRKANVGIGDFIAKKFRRLMIPYFSVSMVLLLIKLMSNSYLSVDNPVTPIDFVKILYSPASGYFLWFSWALWWMMCLVAIVKSRQCRLVLFVASLATSLFYGYFPDIFCVRQTLFFMPYFAAGAVSYDLLKSASHIISSLLLKISSILIFGVLAWLHFYLQEPALGFILHIERIILAFCGIAMSLSISNLYLKFVKGIPLKWMFAISAASYTIYLFHTTFEGFAKGILSALHFTEGSYSDLRWAAAVIIVVTCGTLFPYLLDKYVLKRFKVTKLLFGV